MRILISAGEASGDLYAARLVEAIRARHPDAEFLGCAGPRMQAAGVRAVVDARSLNVVGIVEVLSHLPRIWREFRKLIATARAQPPRLAILTDSPDFHLPLARRLRRLGVPVVYLVAPQVWAWRSNRILAMRRDIDRLLCIFPFERQFFEKRGIHTTYIGHPLAEIINSHCYQSLTDLGFVFSNPRPILALLPGSRPGEVSRHLPILIEAVAAIRRTHPITPVLALPDGFVFSPTLPERIRAESIQLIVGRTWDVLAQSELALAASGTVTIEAALLGIPMVTFYRVNALTWILGRRLVRAPFLTMVNLVAGRQIVPELIQREMTPERIAAEARPLLQDSSLRAAMRAGLAEVSQRLKAGRDPMEVAAECIEEVMQ
ncbi:MAG TPA: lipid-A-disaccharide synthase [Bryobacteraceae bacterium]|nr:lipid-A-disaccharide synthase [Bryobacteraceae bacterium]